MNATPLRFIASSCLLFGLMGSLECRADFKVTLLGTGTPIPSPNRYGPSTLVEAGDQNLLFDAGRGVPIRLAQHKPSGGKIDVLFLTHFHSDHTAGIPDLWLTSWLPRRTWSWGGRITPFRVIGPVGAKALMSNLEKAYALEIKIHSEDQKLPPEGIAIAAEEFDQDGVVYEKNGVKVIAFEVDHGPAAKPAYGYRIEYKGRSVVISGDTRYHPNVIKYGTGADVLIHEVASARPELMTKIFAERLAVAHVTPREAGMLFSQTKPKMAVYTHFLLLYSDKIPPPTPDDLMAQTRETYSGPLEIGEDLMSFEIGDTVTVRRRQP